MPFVDRPMITQRPVRLEAWLFAGLSLTEAPDKVSLGTAKPLRFSPSEAAV